jgi:hypothetical protein
MTNKNLYDKILQASAIINNNSRRGSGNYMVVSPAVANIIKGFRRGYRKEKIKRLFNDEAGEI